MTEHTFSLAPFYKGWDVYQQHLVHALAPLSPEQLNLRAAPHLRSVGQNMAHIIGTRAGWLHYVLGEGGEKLASIIAWDNPDQSSARPQAELVQGLETTWQVIHDCLQRWTAADLDEIFHDTEDNGEIVAYTRQWVIWHLIEHDMHHGGEISFVLGMHGVPAIDL